MKEQLKKLIDFIRWKDLILWVVVALIFFPIMLWAFGDTHMILWGIGAIFWLGIPWYLFLTVVIYCIKAIIKKRKNSVEN